VTNINNNIALGHHFPVGGQIHLHQIDHHEKIIIAFDGSNFSNGPVEFTSRLNSN